MAAACSYRYSRKAASAGALPTASITSRRPWRLAPIPVSASKARGRVEKAPRNCCQRDWIPASRKESKSWSLKLHRPTFFCWSLPICSPKSAVSKKLKRPCANWNGCWAKPCQIWGSARSRQSLPRKFWRFFVVWNCADSWKRRRGFALSVNSLAITTP